MFSINLKKDDSNPLAKLRPWNEIGSLSSLLVCSERIKLEVEAGAGPVCQGSATDIRVCRWPITERWVMPNQCNQNTNNAKPHNYFFDIDVDILQGLDLNRNMQ